MMMGRNAAAARSLQAAPVRLETRMQCPECWQRFEVGKSFCYCSELHRRRAYDAERARKGLASLYRPPSMR